ncbi:MAG TPA: hypothetical protein PLK28_13125 [Candidatus Rifleibacterium sp.]|nr:hypothetical protein [Candidatus Rifleibacterium sp.]HPW57948.1 hypothetical protein [Candidatus Rifleibacterium sp.]
MLTKKIFAVLLVLVGLFSAQVMAFDGVLPGHNLYPVQQKIFAAISDYWQVQELFLKYVADPNEENEKTWNSHIQVHTQNCVEIGKSVMRSLKKSHYGKIDMLSDIYKSLPDGARNALYPTLGYLKFEITHKADEFLTEEKFREYFPGYGYSEPGYKYRKGRELDREYKGVTWVNEEQSISTTWNVSLTVSIDILNILSGMVTGGVIKNLKVSEQFTMNVNGTPMIVCNVSFQRIKSIVTKTNRKFEINKVWFELLRSKSSSWSNSNAVWELTGKTYEILQEPTGEEVVTGIEGK